MTISLLTFERPAHAGHDKCFNTAPYLISRAWFGSKLYRVTFDGTATISNNIMISQVVRCIAKLTPGQLRNAHPWRSYCQRIRQWSSTGWIFVFGRCRGSINCQLLDRQYQRHGVSGLYFLLSTKFLYRCSRYVMNLIHTMIGDIVVNCFVMVSKWKGLLYLKIEEPGWKIKLAAETVFIPWCFRKYSKLVSLLF